MLGIFRVVGHGWILARAGPVYLASLAWWREEWLTIVRSSAVVSLCVTMKWHKPEITSTGLAKRNFSLNN